MATTCQPVLACTEEFCCSSFIAYIPLLMETSAYELERRR